LDRHAWPDVREQIERAAQRQVQRDVTLSDCQILIGIRKN
jgi:hypothetical protein